jgi:ATP-binding cassette subfamily B protein
MRTVRFLYEQLRGYRLVLVLSTAMAFLQVAADLLAAFPLKFILDKVLNHKDPGWPMSGLVAHFDSLGTREGLHSHETYTLMAVIAGSAVLIVILGLIGAAASYVQLYAAKLVGFKVSGRLRTRVFERILRLSVDWHGQMKTGDLVQRLTGNVADLEKLIIDGLVDMMAGILTLVAMVAVMAAFNWQFTLLSIFVVPMLFVIVWSYTKRIKVNTRMAAQAAAQVANVATEDIRAIHEVKAFTLEQAASSHFEQNVDTYRNWGLLAGKLEAQFRPIVAFVVTLSTFTVVGVGSYVATGHSFQIAWLLIPAGTLTIGTLTVFLTYIKQLYQPMRDLSKLMYVGSNAASGAERIQNLLDEPEEVEATVEPVVIPPSARLVGAIDYENVVFGYSPGIPVLRGIDLHIEAGQKLALVGLSGSGKTTLVKLIPRFHVPWEGRILIDGVENQRYPLAVVRKNTSFVLQDSVLFEGTIRDNIAIGRPDASDGQIVAAARQGQIDDFIQSLPGAYDFHVREQGKNFSAGQRQRLAIARAVLRDAPILIMDEPTANLDVEAEAEVMYAIRQLVEGRTVIMISHRLSTLGQVDRIAFLKSGRLVEQGDYETLRYAGGPFARLFQERSTPLSREPRPLPVWKQPDGDGPEPADAPDVVNPTSPLTAEPVITGTDMPSPPEQGTGSKR